MWSDGGDASPLARFTSVSISPDSRQAAGVVVDRNASDIWIADLASGATTRVTFDGTNVSPAWSADGRQLFFATRDGATPFHVVSSKIAERADRTAAIAGAPAQAFPTSAAGGRLALTRYQDGHTAVVLTDSTGGAARALGEGPYDEGAAAISPDGRWVALESSASGRVEVIVRAAEDGRRVAAVSAEGGRRPQWSADGRAIYFVAGRRVLRAAFSPDGGGTVGHAETVLDRSGDRVVAIAPSGRLLVDRQPGADSATVVLQWLRELRERLPLPVSAPR
jgi:Tol biopolymer transport system component